MKNFSKDNIKLLNYQKLVMNFLDHKLSDLNVDTVYEILLDYNLPDLISQSFGVTGLLLDLKDLSLTLEPKDYRTLQIVRDKDLLSFFANLHKEHLSDFYKNTNHTLRDFLVNLDVDLRARNLDDKLYQHFIPFLKDSITETMLRYDVTRGNLSHISLPDKDGVPKQAHGLWPLNSFPADISITNAISFYSKLAEGYPDLNTEELYKTLDSLIETDYPLLLDTIADLRAGRGVAEYLEGRIFFPPANIDADAYVSLQSVRKIVEVLTTIGFEEDKMVKYVDPILQEHQGSTSLIRKCLNAIAEAEYDNLPIARNIISRLK